MNVVLENQKGFVTSFKAEVTEKDVIHYMGNNYTYWYKDDDNTYFRHARTIHVDRPANMLQGKRTAKDWCIVLGLPMLDQAAFKEVGLDQNRTLLNLSEFFMFLPKGSQYA